MYLILLILSAVGYNGLWSFALITSKDECKPLIECPQVYNLTHTRRNHFGTRNLLRHLDRGCPDEGKPNIIKCIPPPKVDEYMRKADLLPGERECGLAGLQEKIEGGDTADLREFPWIALLRYRNDTGHFGYGCHANLINNKYLLTAAHCIKHPRKELGVVYSVILGEYDVRNATDCIFEDCAEKPKEYLIESYIIHPNFANFINDIALLRIKGEVEFSEFIKPICLPPNNFHVNRADTWWIAGWGGTADDKMNDVKQKATFYYKGQDECVVSINTTASHICAGSLKNARSCPGDSGGPLMKVYHAGGGVVRTSLIGILSLGGKNCYTSLQITIFAKTSFYTDWIIESLEE